MKSVLIFCLLLISLTTLHAQHQLHKIWQTDSVLQVPESVLFDAQNKVLYTSLINGDPSQKDGKGGIAKLGLDGKIIDSNWITGLNAPKGLGKYGDMLYAADVTDIVVMSISQKSIIKKIPVDSAQFLNDITVDKNGVVYASDSRTGKVLRIENGSVTTYLENLKNPNGLLAIDDKLYVLASGELFKANAQKQLTKIAAGMEQSTDGIEQVKPGEFVVSCWSGVIYYVSENGKAEMLSDTRNEKMNTADIGYDAENKIVYVPTFFKKSIAAFQLK